MQGNFKILSFELIKSFKDFNIYQTRMLGLMNNNLKIKIFTFS